MSPSFSAFGGHPRPLFDHPIPLRVDVVLGADSSDLDHEAVRRAISSRLAELAGDLAAPFAIELKLRDAEPGEHLRGTHAVSIEGCACRIETTPATAPGGDRLAHDIMQTVFANRTLLVTSELVQAIQEAVGCTEIPAPRVRELLERTFLRLDDLHTAAAHCEAAQQLTDAGVDIELAIERISAQRAASAVEIRVGRSTYDAAMRSSSPDGPPVIEEMLQLMADGLFYELGAAFPSTRVVFDETLDATEHRVRLNKVRGPIHRGLASNECLVNDTPDRLTLLNVEGRSAVNPANGSESAVISSDYADICEQAGLTTWDTAGYVVLQASTQLRRHAGKLFTLASAERALYRLDTAFPMVVFNVLERYALSDVAAVLRGLLDEEVSIRDLRSILEALLALNERTEVDTSEHIVFAASTVHSALGFGGCEETPNVLIEVVRRALRRQIASKYMRGGNTLNVWLLAPDVESELRDAGAAGLHEARRLQLVDAVASEATSGSRDRVILTYGAIRRAVREAIRPELPSLPVVSYQELPAELNILPIARIGWPET